MPVALSNALGDRPPEDIGDALQRRAALSENRVSRVGERHDVVAPGWRAGLVAERRVLDPIDVTPQAVAVSLFRAGSERDPIIFAAHGLDERTTYEQARPIVRPSVWRGRPRPAFCPAKFPRSICRLFPRTDRPKLLLAQLCDRVVRGQRASLRGIDDRARGKVRQAVSQEHCDRRPLRLRNARLSGLELRGQLRRPETVLAAPLRPVALALPAVEGAVALAREPAAQADVTDRVLDARPVLEDREGLTLDALERDDDFAVVLALFRNIHRPMLEPWPARELE